MNITVNISIPTTLFDQTQLLARHLNIAPNDLVAMAIEQFIQAHPAIQAAPPIEASSVVINQGDLYWVNLNDLESNIPHPHVVIQDNLLNQSRIHTVVVCGLTTNLRRINAPGNVLLEVGEGNLPKPSIVEVSKVSAITKTQLGAYIGSLSEQRIHQILAGMRLLHDSFFTR